LRLALGGGRSDILGVVLYKGFRLVVIGTAIGVTVALGFMPALGGFLSGISPRDPLTYGAVVGCFGVVALVASWLPAHRAMSIEASQALRGDI
jgi:ABC-type antimicrobial peptide transport system permease subunit